MSKEFKPRTRPTGFPAGTRTVKVEADGPPVSSVKAWMVKVAYTQERGRFETLQTGETVNWTPPKKYDGIGPVTIEGECEVDKGGGSVWQKLVEWCEARGVPPAAYVRVAFMDLPLNRPSPLPRQLMGPVYEAKWHKYKDKIAEQLELAMETEKAIARRHVAVRQSLYGEDRVLSMRHVLADSSLELSPLFRYCLAAVEGDLALDTLADRFLAEAVLQFECHRVEYKKTWAALLPKGFATMSRRAYPAVLAKLGQGMTRTETSDED